MKVSIKINLHFLIYLLCQSVVEEIFRIEIFVLGLAMEEGRSAFKILTGKPTGKRPLGGPRRRWKDNIRMYLK